MNTLKAITLCLMAAATTAGNIRSPQLPRPVVTSLDRKFPGWRLSQVSAEVQQFFQARFPNAEPNLIRGDFDGNRQMDYAVLIEHSNFDKVEKSFTHVVEELVFLKKGGAYKLYRLSASAPAAVDLYCTLARKGDKGRVFESQTEFRYPNDSISVSYFGKAGGTYIYRNGKFNYVLEAD